MKQPFSTALFLAGLAIVGWIGVGYVGTHALGVVVSLVIGACYVVGAVELQRYRQATASLAQALNDTAPAGNGLQAWLDRKHLSLTKARGMLAVPAEANLDDYARAGYVSGLERAKQVYAS